MELDISPSYWFANGACAFSVYTFGNLNADMRYLDMRKGVQLFIFVYIGLIKVKKLMK